MANPWDDWYSGDMTPPTRTPQGLVQSSRPASSGLKTRTVQALPVDASNWDNPAGDGPANEVRVPALPAFGTGYMSGYTPQDSYRLLPNPGLPSQARDAIETAVPRDRFAYQARPHMALSMPQVAPQMPVPAQRSMQTAPMPAQRPAGPNLLEMLLGGGEDVLATMLGGFGNSGAVTQGNFGPMNSVTQQSPYWLYATGQGGSNDSNHPSAMPTARSLV